MPFLSVAAAAAAVMVICPNIAAASVSAAEAEKTPERAVNNEQIAWKISHKIIMKTFVSIAYSTQIPLL